MKKNWVRPMATVETFTADEYCSACGTQGETYYKFICTAGSGPGIKDYVYLDDGDGEFTEADFSVMCDPADDLGPVKNPWYFQECGHSSDWFTAQDALDFKNGYLVTSAGASDPLNNYTKVKVWLLPYEEGGKTKTAPHCMEALEGWTHTWEVAKS